MKFKHKYLNNKKKTQTTAEYRDCGHADLIQQVWGRAEKPVFLIVQQWLGYTGRTECWCITYYNLETLCNRTWPIRLFSIPYKDEISVDSEYNDYNKPRQCIKRQKHHFVDKGQYSQSHVLSSSHVWMWELDHKEGWGQKNWCLQIMVLEKTPESPLDCKEIRPVDPKENQPWIFIGRTDTEAEIPLLWLPDVKSQLIGKKSWCWERLKAKGEEGGRGWVGI